MVEPGAGSTWRDPVTGDLMGGRDDGGPTSWAADIITADLADSYREFLLAFQDRQLAYKGVSPSAPKPYPGPGPNDDEITLMPNRKMSRLACRRGDGLRPGLPSMPGAPPGPSDVYGS